MPDHPATLTKAQLADALLLHTELDKYQARHVIDAFFTHIAHSLSSGAEVKLTGFGSFSTRSKSERPGRNPRTGEPVPVAARRVVTFRASKKLKEQIQTNLVPQAQAAAENPPISRPKKTRKALQ